MDWVDIAIGVCLVIIGFLWLISQIDETQEKLKKKYYGQLSTHPSQYLGIWICILGGLIMIFRAF